MGVGEDRGWINHIDGMGYDGWDMMDGLGGGTRTVARVRRDIAMFVSETPERERTTLSLALPRGVCVLSLGLGLAIGGAWWPRYAICGMRCAVCGVSGVSVDRTDGRMDGRMVRKGPSEKPKADIRAHSPLPLP